MKCPICNYSDGWETDNLTTIKGKKGRFYTLPIKMEQFTDYHNNNNTLYACPNCGIAFIAKEDL